MLGSPSLSFTIPSVLDDTTLAARVYFPERFQRLPNSSSWRKKVAIVAHPYAPLGGCYDDAVVDLIASAILKQGFVVGTFNFRGAGPSKGRTTLSSKGETNDYISFVGFMTYFLHHIDQPSDILFEPPVTTAENEPFDLSPIESQVVLSSQPVEPQDNGPYGSRPLLVLGGYSYGSLIVSQLPDLETMLAQFVAPELGTAAAEIRLRAQDLAKQQNEQLQLYAAAEEKKLESKNSAWRYSRGRIPTKSAASTPMLSARFGGEETNPDIRRASSEAHGRRSFSLDTPDRIRKSMDKVMALGRPSHGSPRRHQSYHSSPVRQQVKNDSEVFSHSQEAISIHDGPAERQVDEKVPKLELDQFKVLHLIVSPLQGLVTNLVTLWTFPSSSKPKSKTSKFCDAELKLTTHDTLAVFGDNDMFSSIKKLRQWATRLSNAEQSRFRYVEISGAGHFWHEQGVAPRLRAAVTSFIGGL